MRILTPVVVACLAFSSAAQAQTVGKGYVEGSAQSAFGNVTSQSYGGEAGLTLSPAVQLYVDAGRTMDAAPATLGASAQLIAASLVRAQTGAVTYVVHEPSTFSTAGVRYRWPVNARIQPYSVGGVGAAWMTKKVTFTAAGTDVTANLSPYGIVLGSDLAGTTTHLMTTLGGGATYPVGHRIVLDFQYRYGHVFSSEQTLNINRAGLGVGIRFP